MRALLFHNPTAGDGDHSRSRLLDFLRCHGIEARYVSTDEPDFADMLREPTDLIVVAGGDGTVAKVATHLSGNEAPLALLPLGASNNVAFSLGFGEGSGAFADGWQSSPVRSLDRGEVFGVQGSCRFVEAVGIGALARSIAGKTAKPRNSADKVRKGRAKFRETLAQAETFPLTIEVDGKPVSGRWYAIEIANMPFTGPRLHLCDADPGDGRFDVMLIDESNREKVLNWLNEPDDQPPPLETVRAREVRFSWNGSQPLRVDDELIDLPGDVENIAVNVRVDPRPISALACPEDGEKTKEELP